MLLYSGLQLLYIFSAPFPKSRLCLTIPLFAFLRGRIDLGRVSVEYGMSEGVGNSVRAFDLLSASAPGPALGSSSALPARERTRRRILPRKVRSLGPEEHLQCWTFPRPDRVTGLGDQVFGMV